MRNGELRTPHSALRIPHFCLQVFLLTSALVFPCSAAEVPAPDFKWEAKPERLTFTISFSHPPTVQSIDDLIERRCYYFNFYRESGPVPRADWEIPSKLVKRVTRVYYPEQKVLRFVFFTPFHGDVRFVMSTRGENVRVVTVTPITPLSLTGGVKKIAGLRKMVVIDPGHGGNVDDPLSSLGAQTSRKINGRHYDEKDIVLEIAKYLDDSIRRSPNMDGFMTRRTDQYVSLDQRIALANKAQGDFFLSIHLNANTRGERKTARGFEIYYLSSEEKAANRELAALENDEGIKLDDKISGGVNLRDLLLSLADEKFRRIQSESREACMVIDQEFVRLGPFRSHDRGVKSAAFRVLLNFNMPAALAECGFLDTPAEARQLVKPAVQKKIAALLFNGINRYFAKRDPEFAPHAIALDP